MISLAPGCILLKTPAISLRTGGWGDNLWGQGFLAQAVTEGLTTEEIITESTRRTLMQKMKVGLFDVSDTHGCCWKVGSGRRSCNE